MNALQPRDIIFHFTGITEPEQAKYIVVLTCESLSNNTEYYYEVLLINSEIREKYKDNSDALYCQVELFVSDVYSFLGHQSYLDCWFKGQLFHSDIESDFSTNSHHRVVGRLSDEDVIEVIRRINIADSYSPRDRSRIARALKGII